MNGTKKSVQQIEQLIDRLLEAQIIDLHLAADLLGSPLKMLRCDLDIAQHSSK